jgi:hypothetical protein
MIASPLTKRSLYKHTTVTQTARVRTRAEQQQRACTHRLTLYRPHVYLNSKKKMKTDRPNQEETTDIDNQDPLKAWILFLTEKQIMQGKIIRQKQSEIGLLANKTQT